MNTSILSRGFSLTESIRAAVDSEVDVFRNRYGRTATSIDVRLFDVNGPRGGPDKGCLVRAHLANRREMVAIDVRGDLYVAIGRAFAKLSRAAHGALARRRTLRRTGVTYEAPVIT